MWDLKKILGIAAGLSLAVLTFLSGTAAETSVSVNFPVQQQFENHSGEKAEDTFQYVLTKLEGAAPMPGNEQTDAYSFSLSGTEEIKIDEIIYTETGVYRYKVYGAAREKQDGYRYDESQYTVEVYVKDRGAKGLRADLVILNPDGEKCEKITFVNTYEKKISSWEGPGKGNPQNNANPVKTGDDEKLCLWLALLAVSGGILLFGKFAGGRMRP